MTERAKASKSRGYGLPVDKDGNVILKCGGPPMYSKKRMGSKPIASSTKRKTSKTLAVARRLRTLGGLVELHSAVMAEVLSGDLSSNAANGIKRLSRKHLRESKKQRRWPSEDELSELGAAVVALLTTPSKG